MSDLMSAVLDRADADDTLPENAKFLILAALQSDDDLADALQTPRPQPPPPPVGPVRPAVRAFLTSIAVTGFRGIGQPATLALNPAPGLTVVAGRNGCGKSSFAEALEMALTRESYRWKTRKGLGGWRDSWRNLHQGGTTAIQVQLAEEGRGSTTVAANWGPDQGLDDVTSWVQRPGAKREPGLDSLGWADDLELFRPFLSYDELGTLFAEPSKLHDAFSSILGLERLDDAQRRLDGIRKTLGTASETATKLGRELKPLLQQLDDDRARAAVTQLRKRKPDLAAVRTLVTGTGPDPGGDLGRLRQLADLQAPDRADFSAAQRQYQQAAETMGALKLAAADTATRRLDLLGQALKLHEEETGDGPCPVCDQGRLDAAWAERVRDELALDAEAVRARTETGQTLDRCARALTALRTPVPPILATSPDETTGPVRIGSVDGHPAALAWQTWARLGPAEELAAAGPAALETLIAAVAAVTGQARAELARRRDAWQPLAVRLGDWLTAAIEAQTQQPQLDDSRAAGSWLKTHARELRNERFRPLAERSRAIWALLRQDSTVDLDAISLAGVNTLRRVQLVADLDGENAGALAVMSQGELNALALALFLPKATSPDSPFGFVVIDDPVQAMDPAKVDGLALVLQEVARDRQVIVLTHDDRLSEAVRRLKVPAALLEVTRDRQSVVTVSGVSDPAERYLSDARAVASDQNMPDPIGRQIIPQLCRMGIESRCRDVFFGRELLAGRSRDRVEAGWAAALTTRSRISLVVNGNPRANLDHWLDARRHRRRALTVCGGAVHTGLTGNLHDAISDVSATLADLTSGSRR